MGWVFFGVIIVALVWLVTENRTARLIAVLFAGLYGAVTTAFLVWFDDSSPEKREIPAATPPAAQRTFRPLPLTAAALIEASLRPADKIIRNSDGSSNTVPDLLSWKLTGALRADSGDRSIASVTIRIRLYSCPDFYAADTGKPADTATETGCIVAGDRSLALYDLDLKPGQDRALDEAIDFPDQPPVSNWRYRLDIARVTATGDQ